MLVEAENGDRWEMDENLLPLLFQKTSLQIPVRTKTAFDHLVSYAHERSTLAHPVGARAEEELITRRFISRCDDTLLREIARGARMLTIKTVHDSIFEDQLRQMVEEGRSEDEARALLDKEM